MTGWRDDARCRGMDSDVFFPLGEKSGTQDRYWVDVEAAKAVCAACPVAAQCLEFALRPELRGGEFGVWGGLTREERARLVRVRQDQARRAVRRELVSA